MDPWLVDLRRSILASLGLLAACGPTISIDDDGGGSGDETAVGSTASGSATTTATTSPTASDGSSDDGPVPEGCAGATPILQANVPGSVPTGWERCDDGVIHRAEAIACDEPLPPGDACTLEDQSCQSDADCTAHPAGRCVQQTEFLEFCSCQYGCVTDADCAEDQVCACGGDAPGYPERSRCVAATCSDSSSCGTTRCALGSGEDGCGTTYQAACLTASDECRADAECVGDEDCFPQAEGHWGCESFCCCGRPLLVDGHPVTAPAIVGAEWISGAPVESLLEPAGESPLELPAVVRRRIAAHYTEAAQLEHASVASFARFTLELLAVGAPPELLAAAQRAGLDEIDHAQRCFGLASAYAGHPVGPGPLSTAGTSPATTLEAVAAALIDEACVGETLAAVEARAACRHATVPAVRQALAVIAADEQRHAELGWQTLRWALQRCDEGTRARLLARLQHAVAAAERARPPAMVDHDRALLRAHGVLDPADRRAAHTEALAQVLRPCAAALAGSTGVLEARA